MAGEIRPGAVDDVPDAKVAAGWGAEATQAVVEAKASGGKMCDHAFALRVSCDGVASIHVILVPGERPCALLISLGSTSM